MKVIFSQEVNNTILGILAIVFWSTTIAFSRRLTEQLGTLTTAFYVHLVSGILGLLYLTAKPKVLQKFRSISARYLIGCGTLFIAYMLCLYLAIGFASGRQQVLEVGIINYLWPSLTLVLSIPILHKRASIYLLPGSIIAMAGIFLATAQSGSLSWRIFSQNLRLNFISYILAFVASICWALYSNLSRKWGKDIHSGAVPVFLLGTGFAAMAARMTSLETQTPHWTPRLALELLYMVTFPTLLAYVFWDTAMRKGNHILVASFSYLTPLLSMIISSLYLRIKIGLPLWIACALVIAGAIICQKSFTGRRSEEV